MALILLPLAEAAFAKMDVKQQDLFIKHFEKLERMPPRRHLKYGIPYHVEEVGQGRIIYDIRGEDIIVTRCFATHKEYERWYHSLNDHR